MFRPKFNKADIRKLVEKKLQSLETEIIGYLTSIGENFVTRARQNKSYQDDTGNLRSSIAYTVTKYGSIVAEDYQEAGKGTDRVTGVEKARELIQSLADNYPNGYALIVVVGMDYALLVESKGKDLITASAAKAKTELNRAVKEIKRKVAEA